MCRRSATTTTILKKGWFEHLADGTPTNGLPYDRAGSDIDTTNPEAAKWYWGTCGKTTSTKGFDSFWADETEPDLPPNGSYFHVGPGTEYFNVYPLFHTAAFYNGMRQDMKERALILARDAYLGAQHNGTIFWSSDISGELGHAEAAGADGDQFCGVGDAVLEHGYWWVAVSAGVRTSRSVRRCSILRMRGKRWGTMTTIRSCMCGGLSMGRFSRTSAAHGSRPQNEVWSYGKQAEPILEKYLRLRYELMPYIYSLGYATHETGAPFMRGLFMDFGAIRRWRISGDEYMFGPALLVAPVTEQGATTREVYLPAGTDWYNFWTNERVQGGQTITVAAPIDTIPLFVRAGSIVPMGAPVESTNEKQAIAKLRVYPGADGAFELYRR